MGAGVGTRTESSVLSLHVPRPHLLRPEPDSTICRPEPEEDDDKAERALSQRPHNAGPPLTEESLRRADQAAAGERTRGGGGGGFANKLFADIAGGGLAAGLKKVAPRHVAEVKQDPARELKERHRAWADLTGEVAHIEMQFPFRQLELGALLGRGKFASVYLCRASR